MTFSRLKNRIIAKIITRFPSLSKGLVDSYRPWESTEIPWTPVKKALKDSRIALVTTAGVYHRDHQEPFDMKDSNGDPTYRIIDITRSPESLMITHDYYDHSDADRDINIVFPHERRDEYQRKGVIGEDAEKHA